MYMYKYTFIAFRSLNVRFSKVKRVMCSIKILYIFIALYDRIARVSNLEINIPLSPANFIGFQDCRICFSDGFRRGIVISSSRFTNLIFVTHIQLLLIINFYFPEALSRKENLYRSGRQSWRCNIKMIRETESATAKLILRDAAYLQQRMTPL